MSRRTLLDTGPLVAALNVTEPHHAWAVATLDELAVPLSSCEAVVSEAWHLLGRARGGRAALVGLLRSGQLIVDCGLMTEHAAIYRLMTKYADQPMSVAAACLVRMAELDPGATLVTLDRDFLAYRRGRSALRLAAPFV